MTPEPPADPYDVIVIGGGIAALSAAMFSARFGLRTAVVSDLLVGGQILNVEAVENYPGFAEPVSGADLAALAERQASEAGAEFVFGEALWVAPRDGGFAVATPGGELAGRTVIAATGSALRRLGVPGEAEFEGRGVSYCGSCDGAFFTGQPVAVVGGGDSAADEALVVAQHASDVTIVTREPQLRAAEATRRKIDAHTHIRILAGAQPEAILGGETVTTLRVRNGRDGAVADLDVAGVFVYVGLQPNTALLAPLVDLDEDGRVVADAHMQTSVRGLFAAGDIRRDAGGYLVNAASDGATAAASARRLIAGR
jgi:thioredoxin reductase (NADPH)